MKLESQSFEDGARIPAQNAFGKHDPDAHVTLCENRNPHLAWSAIPEGTKSLALIVVDSDVPTKPDDVNKEGRTVPADLPRADFYHWILLDIPPSRDAIAEGELSDGVVARGKDGPDAPDGMRQGINDYTSWFDGDEDMAGTYYGYDGPCPPWNDSIVHHYHFTLYALDIARCPDVASMRGPDVVSAIAEHVIAKAAIVGTYTINPDAV